MLLQAPRTKSVYPPFPSGRSTFVIDGQVYRYCNYDTKGFLLDVYRKSGREGLQRELKLMKPFLYCSGRGITVKDSIVQFTPSGHSVETLQKGTRKVCWKLGFRGVYGESLLHILIICNTEEHTEIVKQLIHKYPALVHDIFESEEYYGK